MSRRKPKLPIAVMFLTLSFLVPKKPAGWLVTCALRVADFGKTFCQLLLILACDMAYFFARLFAHFYFCLSTTISALGYNAELRGSVRLGIKCEACPD
ncbi:MAG TPA: hypothetical protein VLB90_06215 [Pseudomonadales bacterium]|nr:hypothetical protein [Pseudomonadales bacterium]